MNANAVFRVVTITPKPEKLEEVSWFFPPDTKYSACLVIRILTQYSDRPSPKGLNSLKSLRIRSPTALCIKFWRPSQWLVMAQHKSSLLLRKWYYAISFSSWFSILVTFTPELISISPGVSSDPPCSLTDDTPIDSKMRQHSRPMKRVLTFKPIRLTVRQQSSWLRHLMLELLLLPGDLVVFDREYWD